MLGCSSLSVASPEPPVPAPELPGEDAVVVEQDDLDGSDFSLPNVPLFHIQTILCSWQGLSFLTAFSHLQFKT